LSKLRRKRSERTLQIFRLGHREIETLGLSQGFYQRFTAGPFLARLHQFPRHGARGVGARVRQGSPPAACVACATVCASRLPRKGAAGFFRSPSTTIKNAFVRYSKFCTRWTALGQNEKPPFSGLCQLSPAADKNVGVLSVRRRPESKLSEGRSAYSPASGEPPPLRGS
jgi:hypothetical protein